MMNYTVTKNNKMVAIILMAVGIISIAYGFSTGDTTRSWANPLIGNFYFMAIGLGATFFLAVQYVAEVGWSVQIKRVWMAMGQYLPFAGLFMILIFAFGHHDLYSWTHPENYDKTSEHYDAILD
ncbi:MAG: quinol:cytochrome C oxidoreductase, partial [Bacteroidota bacterium]